MQSIIVVTPPHRLDPQIAIAACRAGCVGVLDLGYHDNHAKIIPIIESLYRGVGKSTMWGVRWDTLGLSNRGLKALAGLLPKPVPLLIIAGQNPAEWKAELKLLGRLASKVFVEVHDLVSAQTAVASGFHGLIVKGHESGGLISPHSTFILLQELREKIDIPYWVQGGIGMRSAGAARLAGAAGVVLCEQLWLVVESPLAAYDDQFGDWGQLDGSETILCGPEETPYRVFSRAGRNWFRELEQQVLGCAAWRDALLRYLMDADDPLLPLGQDIAFAKQLARDYGTVGRVVNALRDAMESAVNLALSQKALIAGAPLANSLGTKYPIVQGPMTRVSDTSGFAKAVAEGGAMPVLALSVMRRDQVRKLLTETREVLGKRPWGIGLLGFLPLEFRQEQLDVIQDIKPSLAIIAGGRPSQARKLEALSIPTFIHVPSPGLLDGFIKDGARKFIFEGSECGGHTGPRTSFILWESAIDVLLAAELDDPESIEVLFAGGIHDAVSAAMVATLAVPLVGRGMAVGVLMGTAYIFTRELVNAGGVKMEFQAQALACQETTLLQSGVGIYTRCAKTPFCAEFNKLRRELILSKASDEEILKALELLNIGRLRIASKGIMRNTDTTTGDSDQTYIEVDADIQRQEGLYMLGEVARLKTDTLTVAELHETVTQGSQALLSRGANQPKSTPRRRRAKTDDIAIIGMSCIMPKADDMHTFWNNIYTGVDAITEVDEERWRIEDFYHPKRGVEDKVCSKWGGFLDDIQFDPTVFGIPPASITSTEPVQLLALEVARRALDDAGLLRRSFPKERTSTIFAVPGISQLATSYLFRTMLAHYLPKIPGMPDAIRAQIIKYLWDNELPRWTHYSFPGVLGNVIAGRVANRLDLGGTNYTVDAACASSLAALDVGVRQLRSGDADLALIGAVDGGNSAGGFMAFSQTYALSPNGRCRSFDDSADGIALGEGVAVIVLKRWVDAERDGDHIYALIKGLGSSSDGRNRSLTAPHPQGQIRALKRAYDDADVDPSTVTLIEAHGTGTTLGDKVEIETLNEVFGTVGATPQTCAIGSVKSMIGHTKIVAGLAGLVKGALALEQRVLPPTIGVERPNSGIDFSTSPIYLNTETRPWFSTPERAPRRCGVSAFGFGGTNFHVVLEEYTGRYRITDSVNRNPRQAEPFVFWGSDRSQVIMETRRLLEDIRHPQYLNLAKLAFAVYHGQKRSKVANSVCRLVLIATSVADLQDKLVLSLRELESSNNTELKNSQGIYYGEVTAPASICFMFPGQGSQKVNMLRELIVAKPGLHELFERADVILADRLSQPLSKFIYPPPAFDEEERRGQQAALNMTQIAQPALGVVELTAARVLEDFGLFPNFVAGHSYGEYVALCVAGVIERDDLIRVSEIRGRSAAEAGRDQPSAMAAVGTDGAKTERFLNRHKLPLFIANLNAPEQTIIAGTHGAIDAAIAAAAGETFRVTKLQVTGAFHTPLMTMACKDLSKELARIKFSKASIPVFSNTIKGPYPSTPSEVRKILLKHFVEPVSFVEEVNSLYEAGARIFIEVGPGSVLSGLVSSILRDRPHTTLCFDTPGRSSWLQLAHLLAKAFTLGHPIEFHSWFEGRGFDNITLSELFDKAQRIAEPGPLVWRVDGGRAKPWHKRPEKTKKLDFVWNCGTAETKDSMVPLPGFSDAAASEQISITSGDRTNALNDHNAFNDKMLPGTDSIAKSDQRLALVQQSVSQFIELQGEQQKTLRHFLDFLQATLGVAQHPQTLNASGAGFEQTAQQGLSSHAESLLTTHGKVLATVAPAPILPAEVLAASNLVTSGSDGIDITSLTTPTPSLDSDISTNNAVLAPTTSPTQAALHTDSELPPTEKFKSDLLRVLVERTGYPEDMLDLNALMEADLGIDSIKRIEVFASLKDQYNLMEGRDEEAVFEELSGFKTLNEIIFWYDKLRESEGLNMPTEVPSKMESKPSKMTPESGNKTLCYAVIPAAVPRDFTDLIPCHLPIILLGPTSEFSECLDGVLKENGYIVWRLIPSDETRMVDDGLFEVNFSEAKAVKDMQTLIGDKTKPLGGLINLPLPIGHEEVLGGALDPARRLFMSLKALGSNLNHGAKDGAGWLLNLTVMDGKFGLDGLGDFSIDEAGTLGIAKAAACEWPHLRLKCIDMHPNLVGRPGADLVLQELFGGDPTTEIGFTPTERWRLNLVQRDPASKNQEFLVESGAVILATGGALGITAEIIKSMARQGNFILVLIGRSPIPEEEEASTRDIVDVDELRRFLIADEQSKHGKVKPAEIERRLGWIIKTRMLRRNLAVLKDSDVEVYYQTLDIRDTEAFGALLDEVYDHWGRIDVVLHGAGIINDKLIKDKSIDSFESVYTTKVNSALVLAKKLRPQYLKNIVLFSSVSARFGNMGQADYSAANEVLNKLADRLNATWPNVRTNSINWGPWDSGMVNEELRRLYASKNINLIPVRTGVKFCLETMAGQFGEHVELVITPSLDSIATASHL